MQHSPTPGFWERGEAPSPAEPQALNYQILSGNSLGQGSLSSALRAGFKDQSLNSSYNCRSQGP